MKGFLGLRIWAPALLGASLALFPVGAEAGELEKALGGLATTNRADLRRAVAELGELGDPVALPALEALLEGRLRFDGADRLYIVDSDDRRVLDARTGRVLDAQTGMEATAPRDAWVTPSLNNSVRRALRPALAELRLSSADPAARLAGAEEFTRRPREGATETIRLLLETERDARVRAAFAIALARVDLESGDPERRAAAVRMIGASRLLKPQLGRLLERREDGSYVEPEEAVRAEARRAIARIERAEIVISAAQNLFFGLSLGSILLLAALGLAITFGLMLMLGAYSTFVVQRLFLQYLPGAADFYLLAALPVALAVCCAVGMFLELTVVRHLYGRPLETLLATWGISLVLIQTVRLLFGAQNVEVANPSWLSGGVEVVPGLLFTYNRIGVILFATAVVTLVWLLFHKTQIGLLVRAVTQNRSTAACMGIATKRVDLWTFGLGSGVAGLGGVALSQTGNVGPSLGQSYIVDCFMVVVLGGVGKIAGAVVGAIGLGIVNKFLEPTLGAVLGKILVLVFVILFIQKRPQGLFALKGRVAEA